MERKEISQSFSQKLNNSEKLFEIYNFRIRIFQKSQPKSKKKSHFG